MNIKPCPFCGEVPEFPEAKDVYGTFYEVECCFIVNMSLQIIDSFDWESTPTRKQAHNSYNEKECKYSNEIINIVRNEAIELWNTRK